VVPYRIIHAQAYEPAKQKILIDLLDQQPFRANGKNTCNSSSRRIYSGAINSKRAQSVSKTAHAGKRKAEATLASQLACRGEASSACGVARIGPECRKSLYPAG
jgi:hypothetical protein